MRNIEQQPKQESMENQEISETYPVVKEKEELDNLFSPTKQAESIHQDLAKTTDQSKKLELEQQMEKFTGSEEVVEIKSDIPKDVLRRFDVSKILEHGREKFSAFLKNVDLRTLISYIEAGRINLSRVREIPSGWKKSIEEIKQQKKESLMINPKLYFLSKSRCAEIALEELLTRITEDTKEAT